MCIKQNPMLIINLNNITHKRYHNIKIEFVLDLIHLLVQWFDLRLMEFRFDLMLTSDVSNLIDSATCFFCFRKTLALLNQENILSKIWWLVHHSFGWLYGLLESDSYCKFLSILHSSILQVSSLDFVLVKVSFSICLWPTTKLFR